MRYPYAAGNENEHHRAADANQKQVADNFARRTQVQIEVLQRAAATEALLAIDMNLGRIADCMEALVTLASKVP